MSGRPVFVLGRFPPPFDGQSLATARCADLLEGRHDVRRISTEPPGPLLHHPDPTFDVGRALYFVRLGGRVRRGLAEAPGAPVVWHSASPSTLGHLRDVLTTLPALGDGRPVYAVLHRGSFDRLFAAPLTRPTATHLVRRVTAFVFQSETLAARCAAYVPEAQRVVIPHTVDEALLVSDAQARAKEAAGPGRPLRLLFLSNMIREKGYLDVIDAAALAHGRGLPIHLDLAGNWSSESDRRAFEARVRTSGLSDVVTHHGGVSERADARRLHLQADVFVLPTTHPTETQPIALIEALGAGTPVVTTDRDVLRDLLGSAAPGVLVPPHAPEAIANAFSQLAEPEVWRHASRAARRRFDETFSPDAVRQRWLALLDASSRT